MVWLCTITSLKPDRGSSVWKWRRTAPDWRACRCCVPKRTERKLARCLFNHAKRMFITIVLSFRHLLQIRKNRDNEEKIMENIPGWEVIVELSSVYCYIRQSFLSLSFQVGKWRGEKVFKTLGEEEWVDQTLTEFYGNSPSINRALRKLERQNPQRCVD